MGGYLRITSYNVCYTKLLRSELKISGAETLPLKTLKKSILTREKGDFSKAELDDDLKALKALYFSQGFTKNKVTKKVKISDAPDKNQKQVAVEIIIKEGPRTKVEQVDFQGLSVLSLDEAINVMAMKQGLWYDSAQVEDDVSALQQAVSEKGYPHVQVTADSKFSTDRTRIRITYHVNQGPKVVVGKIFRITSYNVCYTKLLRQCFRACQILRS